MEARPLGRVIFAAIAAQMVYEFAMRVADLDLLFIPESGVISPDHWIERWSGKLSTARRVEADDARATPARIVEMASSARRPALLIGHSTGAIAAALAAEQGARVVGAFLVAPPDDATLRTLDGGVWDRPSRARLAFPSALVASRTDPWAAYAESEALAQAWGCELIDAGEAGRLDAESGHGPWPDGLLKLAGFLRKLG
jgi:predicted alpha/beta hydrolase family esterase